MDVSTFLQGAWQLPCKVRMDGIWVAMPNLLEGFCPAGSRGVGQEQTLTCEDAVEVHITPSDRKEKSAMVADFV